MKKLSILLMLVLVASIICAKQKKGPPSPRAEAKGTISNVAVTIDYGSPKVRKRAVWESLVPAGEVWRAGANENTTVTFDNDVIIGGENLKAGKYGFFIIPNKTDDWVAIFSSKNDGWGTNEYTEKNDVLRINVTPTFVNDNQESLTYTIGNSSIDFAWEKARLSIPVSAK